jgi:protein yorkie
MSSQSSRDLIEQKGPNHQILRINSGANELDELFKAVIGPKDSQIPLSVPMRQRNFPASFFKPPDGSISASHSRESSLDASFSPPLSQPSGSPLSPASPQQQQTLQLNGVPSGLTINHPRAHSSPATLQQTLAVSQAMASAQQQQSVHLRQYSYDIDHIQLPEGWEEGKTANGERYFINHKEKTTTWEDPRRKMLGQQMQQHLRQQTQPRLVVINQNNSNPNNTSNAINNTNSSSTGNLTAVGPLPEGWDQSRTASGEIYFINHVECTTSWFDPRLPIAAQQQSRAQLRNGRTPPPPFTSNSVPSSLVVALQNMNTSGNNSNTDALQQQHQRTVLNLELERQKLRQRQHEILRQNFRPTSLADDNSPINRLPPISSTGIDPFLGGNNGPLNNDCHSRQESADSGLGLGSNYSLPNTPEDFLSIEDTINSADDANNNMNRNAGNDLGLDSLQVANLDLGTENMESDDLVPSLPDDFNADLLSNVEALLDTNRDNIMTWL